MRSYPPRRLNDEKLEKLIWFLPGLASTLLVIFIGILYITPFLLIGTALFYMRGWIALLVPALGVIIAVAAVLCVIAHYRSKSMRLIRKVCKKQGYTLKVRHNVLTTAFFARKGPDLVIDAGEEIFAVKYMPILLRKLQVTFNRTHATMQNTLRFFTKPMFPIPIKKKLKFETDGIFVRPDQKLVKVMLFCPTPVRVIGFKEPDEKGSGLAEDDYKPDVTGMTMVVQASSHGNKTRMVTLKPLETDYNEFEMDNGMQDVWGTYTFGGFAFARYLDRVEFERMVKKEKAHRQSKNAWEKYRLG
ncbi:MAG: hypothetical protein IJW70_03710 [Clostridia bacterium]|nr:hypothetical protein [Clostridia bacterium]